MSNPWMQYSSSFRLQSAPGPSHILSAPISSTPVASASATPISQKTTITSNVSLQQLYADVKAILQCVEASHEQQKKMSNDLNELGTSVKVLEGVLCGNVGPSRGKKKKKKGKNMDLETVQLEGGIVRRLATMDGAINDLLERVSSLDTACRHPQRTPSPPVQKEYSKISTATDDPLPATSSTPSACPFRPWLPPVEYSPETLAPADWTSNRAVNNSYRAPAFPHSQDYIHDVQRDPSLPGSSESRASPDSTTSPEVFNHISSPAITDVSSRSAAPTTLHAGVPVGGPDIFSPFPTPSPETPLEESFSRVNDNNEANIRFMPNSRSWTASQPRRDGPDQNMSTTSLHVFPNSLLNPILPSSAHSIHNPARTSIPSAFTSFYSASSSKSNSAPLHITPTLTSPHISSTSVPSNHNALLPASNLEPIPHTPPSPSPSSSAPTATMHLASPPPTPIYTLAGAHVAALRRILPQIHHDTAGDVDCEGPCADCETRRWEHQEHRGQSTDSQEQNAEEETRDQSTIADLSRMCFDTSPGDIGPPPPVFEAGAEASPPVPEAQPEVLRVPLSTFETRDHPSPSFEAAQLEGSGIEPEVSLSASKTWSPARESSNDPSRADLDTLQKLIHECELPPGPGLGAARMREDGGPRGTGQLRTDDYGEVNRDFDGPSIEESLGLDHTPDTGGALHGFGHEDSGECEREEGLQVEPEGGGLDGTLEESVTPVEEHSGTSLTPSDIPKPADTRDGCPREYRQEHLTDPEDSVQPEPVLSELHLPTPSDLAYLDADYLYQYQDLHAEDSREHTPADSLFRDEQAVAAALAAPSPSVESESPPLPSSPEHLSVRLPLQPELEAPCLGVRDKGDDPTLEEPTEILDYGDDIFATFADFMNPYTDGATSALRSTYTEDLVEQESIEGPVEQGPAEMHMEHEPAATIDHRVYVEPDITTTAELSAPLEHPGPGHSPSTFATPLPSASPSSLSYQFRSLSPLSSLGESQSALEEETEAGDQEGRNEIGVELRRTGSLDSDDEFGVYQRRPRAGSSISVLRRKMLLRSMQSGELKGGPDASVEELTMLAKKDPRKILISELKLKRKLESSESTIQSRSPGKKTRLHADMDATSFSADDVASSFTALAHQLQRAGDPMCQSSDPSASEEDVMALQVESISAPMEVDSARAIGITTISEPAQTFVIMSELTRSESPANESREDPTTPGKRARPPSWKARQTSTQNIQQSERSVKPKSRRPQKRKSKSLAFQAEAQMCQWPAKSEQDGSFQRQFVQCDNCELWYHFGCVGFAEGDPRLEELDSVFICPPCCVSSAKRQTLRKRAEICARPDCSLTRPDTEEFVIERLVGRKTVGEAGYLFLVKWEGYPIAQASWIPEGSVTGVSRVFDQFVADVTAEGINLNPKGVVLLEEARDGGWNV